MNETYHRMWILEKGRIARKLQKHMCSDEKRELLYEILVEMDLLEAEAVLGE